MASSKSSPRDILDRLMEKNMNFLGQMHGGDGTEVALALEGVEIKEKDKKLPRVYIWGPIGKGGQGIAYKAWDDQKKRTVCVKMAVYESEKKVDSAYLSFQREAKFYRKLKHQNVASIIFDGTISDTRDACLVLERCRGNSLTKLNNHYRKHDRKIPLQVRSKIMEDATEAVKHCSERGIAHCDLSSSNFIWYPSVDKPVKLIDFGMAVWLEKPDECHDGEKKYPEKFRGGTDGFWSPEALMGLDPNVKSDVFGLGCLFYYLIAGHRLSFNWKSKVKHNRSLKSFVKYEEKFKSERDRELQRIEGDAEENLVKEMLQFDPEKRLDYVDVLKKVKKMRPVGNAGMPFLSSAGFASQEDSMVMRKDVRQEEGREQVVRTVEAVAVAEDDSSSTSMQKAEEAEQGIDAQTAYEEESDDDEPYNVYMKRTYAKSLAALSRESAKQDEDLKVRISELEHWSDPNYRPQMIYDGFSDDLKKKVSIKKQEFEATVEEARKQGNLAKVSENAEETRDYFHNLGEKAKRSVRQHLEKEEDMLKKRKKSCDDAITAIEQEVRKTENTVHRWELNAKSGENS